MARRRRSPRAWPVPSEVANHYVQVVLTGVATVLLDLVIFLMMLFFLLRDGDDLRESLRGISPFTRGQETELLDHLGNTVKAVLQAMIIVPLIQGIVAFFGFWAFGVPSPLLWAVDGRLRRADPASSARPWPGSRPPSTSWPTATRAARWA